MFNLNIPQTLNQSYRLHRDKHVPRWPLNEVILQANSPAKSDLFPKILICLQPYCLRCAQGHPCSYNKRPNSWLGIMISDVTMWLTVVQCTLLHSSLCTLSLWSWGLKERPYQCPPGPTPPLESVSSGVKAGGESLADGGRRKETKKCNEGEIGREEKGEKGNKVVLCEGRGNI